MNNENIRETTTEHYLLFTGHMIDKAGRTVPRFPADREDEIRDRISKAIEQELMSKGDGVTLKGIAGGACGGDILFLEACVAAGIPCEMELALPKDSFVKESVAFAGKDWVERFERLYNQLPHKVCSPDISLPESLTEGMDHSVWSLCNLSMLHKALTNGGEHMTLMALWNGAGGDGPGGTEHMVKTAERIGAKTIIIRI